MSTEPAKKSGIKYSKGVEIMLSQKEMQKRKVCTSTQIHNHIADLHASRRNKVTIVSDNQQERKERLRERLRKKLAAKKKN